MSKQDCTCGNQQCGFCCTTIQIVSMFNSVGTAVLYGHTINEFLPDMEWGNEFITSVHDISYKNASLIIPCLLVWWSTQRAFSTLLSEKMGLSDFMSDYMSQRLVLGENIHDSRVRKQTDDTEAAGDGIVTDDADLVELSLPFSHPQKQLARWKLDSHAGAMIKALVLSSSFTVFIKKTFDLRHNWSKGLTLALSTVMLTSGNYSSEFSVFAKPFLNLIRLPECLNFLANSDVWSHALSLMYNVCNVTLYGNNLNKFRQDMKGDHTFLACEDALDDTVVIIAAPLNLAFLCATQMTFARLHQKMFAYPKDPHVQDVPRTNAENVANILTILYKSIVSTMGIVKLCKNEGALTYGSIGALALIGNLFGQYSIFATVRCCQTDPSAVLPSTTARSSQQPSPHATIRDFMPDIDDTDADHAAKVAEFT